MMQVEGVSYDVNWRAFRRGSELFFPCLDPKRARKSIRTTCNRLRIKIVTKVVIVEGIRGLRVWRM